MDRRSRLAMLTERWRTRHDARRAGVGERPLASRERESLAARSFPYRSVDPEAYVALHGASMIGYTYDDERYSDPSLDAWLLEVGRLLRARR